MIFISRISSSQFADGAEGGWCPAAEGWVTELGCTRVFTQRSFKFFKCPEESRPEPLRRLGPLDNIKQVFAAGAVAVRTVLSLQLSASSLSSQVPLPNHCGSVADTVIALFKQALKFHLSGADDLESLITDLASMTRPDSESVSGPSPSHRTS